MNHTPKAGVTSVYTVHLSSTLYVFNVQFALNTVHFKIYTIKSKLYNVCCAVCILYCTLPCSRYALHCILYSLHHMLYIVHCSLYDIHCTMYATTYSTMYTWGHCMMYGIYCMVYIALRILRTMTRIEGHTPWQLWHALTTKQVGLVWSFHWISPTGPIQS